MRADLKFFLGRQPSKRARKRDLQWFTKPEAHTLLGAARELQPRWYPFLMVSFGGGLRWGEATALYRTDLDGRRGRLHVQRTWSEDGSRIENCKDGESRWVKLSPAALKALQAHLEAMSIEGAAKDWTDDQKRLAFPNSVGRVTRYGTFMEHVWQPLLSAAKLTYRKPHSMRHSFAAWLLEEGTDIRYVQRAMGHASIQETVDTYGHLEVERQEPSVAQLDDYLSDAARVPSRLSASTTEKLVS